LRRLRTRTALCRHPRLVLRFTYPTVTEFVQKGKLYIADFAHCYSVHTTQVVTKAEEARDKRAYELLGNAGFLSVQEAIHLVQDGNVTDLPAMVAADFYRAIELFGPPVKYVRGKTTKKVVSRAIVDGDLILEQKWQVLYADVMHIECQRFLVSMCEPLQLTPSNVQLSKRVRTFEGWPYKAIKTYCIAKVL
jgi:hypothetical protein